MWPGFYDVPEPGNLVRLTLIIISINDVLIVVNRAGVALIVPCQLGRLEVADVEDVRDGQLAGSWALYPVALVELIVKYEELLVHYIENSALVDVLCAGI